MRCTTSPLAGARPHWDNSCTVDRRQWSPTHTLAARTFFFETSCPCSPRDSSAYFVPPPPPTLASKTRCWATVERLSSSLRVSLGVTAPPAGVVFRPRLSLLLVELCPCKNIPLPCKNIPLVRSASGPYALPTRSSSRTPDTCARVSRPPLLCPRRRGTRCDSGAPREATKPLMTSGARVLVIAGRRSRWCLMSAPVEGRGRGEPGLG